MNWTASTGRVRTTSSGSWRTQLASSPSRRSRRRSGIASSMISAARSKSSAASACWIACESSPFVWSHSAARWWSSTAEVSPCSSRCERSTSANRWWYRYQVRFSSRGTRNKFDRSSSTSIDAPPVWPVTASQRGPERRSSTEVAQQETADLIRLAVKDFLDQVVDDEPLVPGEPRDRLSSVVSTSERQPG